MALDKNMNNDLSINYEEQQKEIDNTYKLLEMLIKCREAKQDFEWKAYNIYANSLNNLEIERTKTEETKYDHVVTTAKKNVIDYFWGRASLGRTWDITETRRFYCEGYHSLDNTIQPYYEYTMEKKRFSPGATLCHVTGLKNPYQDLLKWLVRDAYETMNTFLLPATRIELWSDFVSHVRSSGTYRRPASVLPDPISELKRSGESDEDFLDAIAQALTDSGYSQAAHYQRDDERRAVLAKLYDEYTSGMVDENDPDPVWTWKCFANHGDYGINESVTFPQTLVMYEAYNNRWQNIAFTFRGYPCLSPSVRIPSLSNYYQRWQHADIYDYNVIDLDFKPIQSSMWPYYTTNHDEDFYPMFDFDLSDYEGMISELPSDEYDFHKKSIILLNEEELYHKGLSLIGGHRISFVPSIDANGDWMNDTIDFYYIDTGVSPALIDMDQFSTSDIFFLYFKGQELYALSENTPYEYYEDVIEKYYTESGHASTGKYERDSSSDKSLWNAFTALYPHYEEWIKLPDGGEWKALHDEAVREIKEYFNNNFSLDYRAEVGEYEVLTLYQAIAGLSPDPNERAKIKQIIIRSISS